jgi:hypothetical protein
MASARRLGRARGVDFPGHALVHRQRHPTLDAVEDRERRRIVAIRFLEDPLADIAHEGRHGILRQTMRQAMHGRGDRLAGRLQRPERPAYGREMLDSQRMPPLAWRRHDHVVGIAELGEIGPGTEGGGLARPQHHAPDVAAAQPAGKGQDLVDGRIGEHVHRPARHVEHEMQDAVRRQLGTEFPQRGDGQRGDGQRRDGPHRIYLK